MREIVCWSIFTNTMVDDSLCNRTCGINLNVGSCNTMPCITKEQTEFSCDPNNIHKRPMRCSDLVKDGGRLTIDVLSIQGADKVTDCSSFYGLKRCGVRYKDPFYAGTSDPYIKVKVKGRTLSTSALIETSSGIWGDGSTKGESMFFGLQASGTPVLFELWDRNGGLTYEDRFVTSVSTTVIACSFASTQKFGPCMESTYLSLWPNASCFIANNASVIDPSTPCIRVQQTVQSHNITVAYPALGWNASLSIARQWSFSSGIGDLSDAGKGGVGPWTGALDASWPFFKRALGGIIVKFAPPPDGPSFASRFIYEMFTLNYRSRVYLFRYSPSPQLFAATEPTWLANGSWTLLDAKGPNGLSARLLNISAPAIAWDNLTANSEGVPCLTTSPSAPASGICTLQPSTLHFNVTACSSSPPCALSSAEEGPCISCGSPGLPIQPSPQGGLFFFLAQFLE